MKIVDNIFYIGVNDYELDLFEGQYPIPNGMAYNSYVIKDDKIAVMDTVDANFSDLWLDNIGQVLDNKNPDYLVIHHMEPDHSSSLDKFVNKYPNTLIVGNKKVYNMILQFFPSMNLEGKFVEVKEGEELSLGKTTLKFYFAAMVHWPEVMMTYVTETKALFSADAFGKFGALDHEEEWLDEARRYYFGIVGKYGKQVQAILKKLSDLEIKYILSLHGPVLKDNIEYYINLYDTWSKYESEVEGVLIAYASMYGNTKSAAEILYNELKEAGVNVEIYDLARTNVLEVIPKAFKYDKLVLASPTYNTNALPFLDTFISGLTSRNFQNKKVGFIENGSWAITAARKMKEQFASSPNIEFIESIVSITSTISEDNKTEINELKTNLMK